MESASPFTPTTHQRQQSAPQHQHNNQLGFQSIHSLHNASPSPTSKLFALSLEHAQLQRSLDALGGTSLLELRECLAEKDSEIESLTRIVESLRNDLTMQRRGKESWKRKFEEEVEKNKGIAAENSRNMLKDEALARGEDLKRRAKAELEEGLKEIVRANSVAEQAKKRCEGLAVEVEELRGNNGKLVLELNRHEKVNFSMSQLLRKNEKEIERLTAAATSRNIESNTRIENTELQLQRISAKYNKAKSIIATKEKENVDLKRQQTEYMDRQLKKAQRLRALVNIKNLKKEEYLQTNNGSK